MKFLRQKSIIVLLLVASIILLTYSSIICVNAKPGRNTAINTANRIAKNGKDVTRIFNQHARIDDEDLLHHTNISTCTLRYEEGRKKIEII